MSNQQNESKSWVIKKTKDSGAGIYTRTALISPPTGYKSRGACCHVAPPQTIDRPISCVVDIIDCSP